MSPVNDPFETIFWSVDAEKIPEKVLADIFEDTAVLYLKTTIQVAYRAVWQNKAMGTFQNNELFRVHLRISSLILLGAYFYKKNKKRMRKREKGVDVDDNAWSKDESAQHNGFLQFYVSPQYRIFCLFEMDTIAHWKAEWAYFVLAAFRKRKYCDTETYPSLNYFIHTLIDALYEIHQYTLKQTK